MLLDIQDFDGLEVRRSPGLGCISFPASASDGEVSETNKATERRDSRRLINPSPGRYLRHQLFAPSAEI